jgi:nicotinate-nucleotide adenylyltransferase
MNATGALSPRRIGIYGGTFDPIHVGHIRTASVVKETCNLDQVVFVPAMRSPTKQPPVASPADRVAMVRLAVAALPWASVSTCETLLPPPSFTIDTIRAIAASADEAELFLVVGADVLAEFMDWRGPEEILRLSTLVAVERPGSRLEVSPALARLVSANPARVVLVHCETPSVSSRDIRASIARGGDVWSHVGGAVASYIATHRLYRASPLNEGKREGAVPPRTAAGRPLPCPFPVAQDR